MSNTLSTLGVVVTQTGVNEAKAEIIDYGNAGDAASKKVVDSFRQTSQAAQQMAQDLTPGQRMMAQLGVTADQVGKAMEGDAAAMRSLAAATNQVTVASTQASAALTRMSAPAVTFRKEVEQTTEALTRMSAPAVSGFRQLEQEVVSVTRMAAPAVTGFRQMADVQEVAGKAAGVHGLQLGRVNMELGTAVGRFLGVNTAATRFVAMLGGSLAGYGEMIAVLGVITLLSAAYEKLTESTRKQTEEQERLNKATKDYIDNLGRPAGDIGKQVENEQAQIDALNKRRDTLKGTQTVGGFIAGGVNKKEIEEIDQQLVVHTATMRVLEVEQQRLTNSSKDSTEQAALEVQHQQALNAAYGQSSVAIARINADYKLRADLIKNAADYTGYEKVQMDDAAKATRDATIAAAANAAGVGEQRSKIAELNAALPTLTAGLNDLQPSMLAVNALWADQLHNVQQLKTDYPGIVKDIQDIAAANERVTKAQVNEAADAIKKQQKYGDDISKIVRDGIGSIVTDGLKSFQDFTEDAFRLFSRLMDRMKQEGKDSGLGYNLLGLGAAAVGGASAGYSSGSATTGILTGAITGGLSAGPMGALVGGVAGLTGALFGGAKAAKERRAAEEELTRSYQSGIDSIRNQVGDLSDLDYAIAQAKTQADAQRAQALQLYGGDSALNKYFGQTLTRLPDALKQIQELEDKRIKQLNDEAAAQKEAATAAKAAANQDSQQNSHLRYLNATGQSDAAFDYQQSLELSKAIADGLDGISLSEIIQAQWAEKAQRENEKQTQVLQDQLSTAQQNYDALKGVVDSLTAFKSSLAIGQYSPLSPRQQLDAARAQLNSIYQAALGGDQNAAGQFSTVAQSYLDASRKYNASGAGYVLDYNSVNVMTDKLTAQFGQQMSDAQKQVSLLQQQLDVLKSIDASTITIAQRPLTPSIPTPVPVGGSSRPTLQLSSPDVVAVLQAGFNALLAAQSENTDAVEENTTLTTRKLDSLTSATLRSA